MIYLIIFLFLFLAELLYFRVANHYNIIDKPNERSSHTMITLRGGGIIFYIAVLFYYIYSGYNYPWFFIGLTMMTVVSFLDDVFTLSNKIRLLIHFSAVLLMVFQLDLFEMPWYVLLIGFVIVVGVINAYNFMDGINGITVSYSLSVACLLLYTNSIIFFIDSNLLIFLILSLLVFGFFNFRNQAKCFAGDVGSVSVAYILIFCIGLLIVKTGNLVYILYLSVYGIDAVWTIVMRLYRRENIFEAHRSHLYQILANEKAVNRLMISSIYGLIQFVIGYWVINNLSTQSTEDQIFYSILFLLMMSVGYLLFRNRILRSNSKVI